MRRCSSLPSGENDNTQQQNRLSLPWYHGLNKQKRTSSENEFFKLLGSRIMITGRKPNGTKVLYVCFPRPVTKVTKLQFINNEEK